MPESLKKTNIALLIENIEHRCKYIGLNLEYSIPLVFNRKSITELSSDELVLLYKICHAISSYEDMRQGSHRKFYLGVKFEDCFVGCAKNSFTSDGSHRAFFVVNENGAIALVSAAPMSRADRDHNVEQHIQTYFSGTYSRLSAYELSWEAFKSKVIESEVSETEVDSKLAEPRSENPLDQISDTLEKLTDQSCNENFSMRRIIELLECFSKLLQLKKGEAESDSLDKALLCSKLLFFRVFNVPDIKIHFAIKESVLQLVYIRGKSTQRHDIIFNEMSPEEFVSQLSELIEDFIFSVGQAAESELKDSEPPNASTTDESRGGVSNFAYCIYGSWPVIPATALKLAEKHRLSLPLDRNLRFALLKEQSRLIQHPESVKFLVNLIVEESDAISYLNRASAFHFLAMVVRQDFLSNDLLEKSFKKLENLISLGILQKLKSMAVVTLPKFVSSKLKQYCPPPQKKLPRIHVDNSVQEIKAPTEEKAREKSFLEEIKEDVTKAIKSKNKKLKEKAWSSIKQKIQKAAKQTLPPGLFEADFLTHKGTPMSLYGIAYNCIRGNSPLLKLLEKQAMFRSQAELDNFFVSAVVGIFKVSDWTTLKRLLLCGFKPDNKLYFETQSFFSFIVNNIGQKNLKNYSSDFIEVVNTFVNSLELLENQEERLENFMGLCLIDMIHIVAKSMAENNEKLFVFFNKMVEHLLACGADSNLVSKRYGTLGKGPASIEYTIDVTPLDLAISLNFTAKQRGYDCNFGILNCLLKHGARPMLGINTMMLMMSFDGWLNGIAPEDNRPQLIKDFIENMDKRDEDRERLPLISYPIAPRSSSLANTQIIGSIPLNLRNHPILILWAGVHKLEFVKEYVSFFGDELLSKLDFVSLDAMVFCMAIPLQLSLLFKEDELTKFLLSCSAAVHIRLEEITVKLLVKCFNLPWIEKQLLNATLLHLAVLAGNNHAFEQLLDKGVDPSEKNGAGDTVESMILKELEKGQQTEVYQSMLCALFKHELDYSTDAINVLVTYKTRDLGVAFRRAAAAGDIDSLETLYQKDNDLVCRKGISGKSALFVALEFQFRYGENDSEEKIQQRKDSIAFLASKDASCEGVSKIQGFDLNQALSFNNIFSNATSQKFFGSIFSSANANPSSSQPESFSASQAAQPHP